MKRNLGCLLAVGLVVVLWWSNQNQTETLPLDFPVITSEVFGKVSPGEIHMLNSLGYNYFTHRPDPDRKVRSYAMIFNKKGEISRWHKVQEPYGFNFSKNPDGGYLYGQAF